MARPKTKSLSFRKPPALTSSSSDNTSARSQALSPLKSDGHLFLTRFSSRLWRSKSQYGLSVFSSTNINDKRNAVDTKFLTDNILESDSRYELSRYRRRREQTEFRQAADPQTKRRKDSGNSDFTDENYSTPVLSTAVYAEKSTWISGLKSYLNLKKREIRLGKHHKKSKSALISTQGSSIYHDTITDDVTYRNNRSGILVKKQSVKSLLSINVPNSSSVCIAVKPTHLQRQRSQSCVTRQVDHQRNLSCLSSSDITVNSEDLTAREFADMTGIRIFSDDEATEDELAIVERSTTWQKMSNSCYEDLNTHNSLVSTPHATVYSTHITGSSFGGHSKSSSTYKKPQIWEQDFWKNSEDLQEIPSNLNSTLILTQESGQTQRGLLPLTKSKSLQIEICSQYSVCTNHRRRDSTPMLSVPKTVDRVPTDAVNMQMELAWNKTDHESCKNLVETAKRAKNGQGQSKVVRKGRFEIVYGSPPNDNSLLNVVDNNPLLLSLEASPYIPYPSESTSTFLNGEIIEWKRKKRTFRV